MSTITMCEWHQRLLDRARSADSDVVLKLVERMESVQENLVGIAESRRTALRRMTIPGLTETRVRNIEIKAESAKQLVSHLRELLQ